MPHALPRLAGRWLAAYRALWAAALLAAIGAAIAGQIETFTPVRIAETATLLTVAILLFRRRGGDAIAAMLSLAFLLWIVTASSTWAGMSAAAVPLAMLDRFRFLIFVTAMMLFPAGLFEPRWAAWGVAATFGACGLGMMEAAGLTPPGLYVPPAMACAALAVAAMRARFSSLPPGIQRQQIKWVALGLAVGLCLVGLSRLGGLFLPLFPEAPPFPRDLLDAVFDLGVTAIALGVLLSLLRFRLYDADAAISRSSTAAALTLALVGIFAGTETIIQSASQTLFGDMTGTISSGIAAAVAAAFVAPIHGRAGRWAERRFQREIAALREELPDLLADLRETADLGVLGEALLTRIERGLRTSRSALLVEDSLAAARHVTAHELDAWRDKGKAWRHCPRNPDDPLFPLRVPLPVEGAGIIGWLLLGPRPDGSALGKDEREALAGISGPAARALCAVHRRAARDKARERLIDLQAARLDELARRLALLEQPELPKKPGERFATAAIGAA